LGLLVGTAAASLFAGPVISKQVEVLPREEEGGLPEGVEREGTEGGETPPLSLRQERSPKEIETGVELLDFFGLRGKIVYIVYGGPSPFREGWGSLKETTSAEEGWRLLSERRKRVMGEIGRSADDFALNILNPAWSASGVDIPYIEEALRLAPENNGLVAPSFNNIDVAREVVGELGGLDPFHLARLAVCFDIENFPDKRIGASSLNEFSRWFFQKHKEWVEKGGVPDNIPGIVLAYTFWSEDHSMIDNIAQLEQYYLEERGLLVPIFDGRGTKGAKSFKMERLGGQLPDNDQFPSLLGAMEFRSTWGNEYDKCSVQETFSLIPERTPVAFFASQ